MSIESDAINRIAQDYTNAINSGDLNRWLETLTDDVVFLPGDQPSISGRKAVRDWAKETFFDPFRMKLNLSFDDLEVSGALACAYGRFTNVLSPTGGGNDTEMVGKFIDIFRLDSDGAWKFARVMYTSDEPVGR